MGVHFMQPMLRIVSVAPSGRVTTHWQLTDLAVARRIAGRLASRLGDLEVVKIRGVIEVVNRLEVEIDDAIVVQN